MTTDPRTGLPAELFTTIDHVGIAVPDLDEALAFYAQAFGVHSVHEEVNEEQGVREAMLAVGGGETRIQLLAPLTMTERDISASRGGSPTLATAGLCRRTTMRTRRPSPAEDRTRACRRTRA